MGRTAIVVPCFNEANRLDEDAFLRALEGDAQLDLLLVDDGSTDATLDRLRTLASRQPERIAVEARPGNAGKAAAVRAGMQRALDTPGVAYAGFFDADLATPLDEIDRLRRALETDPSCLAAFAARVKLLGFDIERHAWRHYLGRAAATLISTSIRVPVYDSQCGAKLFRAGEAAREVFATPFLSRWLFDVEILVRCRKETGGRHLRGPLPRVREVPVQRWHDAPGSKIGSLDYGRALGDLVRIRRHYGRLDRIAG